MLRKDAMPLLHKMLKKTAPPKTLRGRVATDGMQKSVTVTVPYYQYYPKIQKYIRRHRKFMAHDEHDECRVGDLVEISPVPRLSKHKHFCVSKIVIATRLGTDPLFPIEAMPPTLVPERALAPRKYLEQDSYRDVLDGITAPYISPEAVAKHAAESKNMK